MMKKLLILSLLLFAATPALAGRPAPYEVCSPNGAYCVMLIPFTGHSSHAYSAADKQAILWEAQVYSSVAALADDGQHLVIGSAIMPLMGNIVPLDYEDFPLLVFYRRGHVFRTVKIDKVMTQTEIETRRVGDYYKWGEYLGLDEDGYFVVRSATGREIRFDITTGRQVR